jgi:hypothetical protein
VLDGRDIGTVVFPTRPVKLFVTASVEARAAAASRSCGRGAPRRPGHGGSGAAAPRHAGRGAPRGAAPRRAGRAPADTTTLDIEAAFAAALAMVRKVGGGGA